MVNNLSGIKKGSLVYRFITSGKPGKCELCGAFVEKLEAHHLLYRPEIIIKICHNCHHKVHFWPNRLSDDHLYKLLRLRFSPEIAQTIMVEKKMGIRALAKLIAPSRSAFVRKQQDLEIKRIEPKHNKVFKESSPGKNAFFERKGKPRGVPSGSPPRIEHVRPSSGSD